MMDEVIREFLLESHENLAQLDADLVALEQQPHQRETLARVFRTLHTVKGTAGFLGFANLQAVAHAAEHLLTKLRNGELVFNPDIADALLAGIDAIREMLANVEAKGREGEGDYRDLIRWIDDLQPPPKNSSESNLLVSAVVSVPKFPSVGIKASESELNKNLPSDPITPLSPQQTNGSLHSLTARPNTEASISATKNSAILDSAVRVDVRLLDKLMAIAGELVLARNQILQHTNTDTFRDSHSLLATVQRLNSLTSDLQANVMQTRMQPISSVWNKLPRVVRDLATACGKKVSLEISGQETELDKTVIEAIRDPLTHIIRNSIDHGIEFPELRRKIGKAEEGRLTLKATHSGGTVTIEISDDGTGIHPQKIREKAIRSKLITADDAVRIPDHELLQLIFMPGFSTTDQVTQFSGRGVGMDVVRTRIEEIGGTVELESKLGLGTTLRLKIPLTLAIIPALIISADSQKLCIPMTNVEELLRFDVSSGDRLETVQGGTVFRVRNEWLPIVDLNEVFRTRLSSDPRTDASKVIIVVQFESWRFGILVDAIHDTEEIVVKPLQHCLKSLIIYSGATVLGDGRVALILDVGGLAKHAQLSERAPISTELSTSASGVNSDPFIESLVVELNDGGRVALPLNIVDRIEEIPTQCIETLGGKFMIQYRSTILPIYDLEDLLSSKSPVVSKTLRNHIADRTHLTIVVCSIAGRSVGLIVSAVIDITVETIAQEYEPSRSGALFNAIVLERITEFLDVGRLRESIEIALSSKSLSAHLESDEMRGREQ